VTVRLPAVKLLPLTLKLCGVEATPCEVLKAGSSDGVTLIDGVEGGLTVPLTATFRVSAPVLATCTLPTKVSAAAAVKRT